MGRESEGANGGLFEGGSLGWQNRHIQNLRHYDRLITRAYEAAIERTAALRPLIAQLKEGELFTFDAHPEIRGEIDAILADLQRDVSLTLIGGIRAQWELAEEKNDSLARAVLGLKPGEEIPQHYQRYFQRDGAALEAFVQRRDAGMNLSARVWKLTAPFKEELEAGLALMLEENIPSPRMASQMKQYLKEPNRLFRRVRDKAGQLQLSKPARAYHPGRGVYRSSYMNAKRLTVTETNIAYRVADQHRWEQLDFIVGQEIRLSNNHTLNGQPFHDVCDELQGRYPKDFRFSGWHPFCRCHCVPILKTEAEMEADAERLLSGQEPSGGSENWEGEPPAHFTKWVEEHQAKIDAAAARGKLPYFLRDNGEVENGRWGVKGFRQPIVIRSPHEIARERHAKRTPEHVASILKARREALATRKYGGKVAQALAGISDVDTRPLLEALKRPDNAAILAEASKLKAVYKEIHGLTLLESPMAVARAFSLAEAKKVQSAVESKLAQLQAYAGGDLALYRKKLEFEIGWLYKNQKYTTWEVAQDAYRKELARVIEQMEWQDVMSKSEMLLGYVTKSKVFKGHLAEAAAAIAEGDLAKAKQALANAEAWKVKNEKRRLKQELAKYQPHRVKFAELDKGEIDALLKRFKSESLEEVDSRIRALTQAQWASLSASERHVLTKYTQTYSYLNEPLRGIPYKGDRTVTERKHDLPLLTYALSKMTMPTHMVVRRGTNNFRLPHSDLFLSDVKKGDTFVDYGFLSTSVHVDKGFDKGINLIIIVPEGAQGFYAEPFSHYTDKSKFDFGMHGPTTLWDGLSKETLGNEMEWIGQRGAKFKVLKREGENIYLQMIEQLAGEGDQE